MNLDFTEEQEMLRETVRGVCERYVPVETARALEDDPVGYSPDFWKQLGDLGLLGLTLPEEYGGSAMSVLDAAVVYEEFGRTLAPSPHFVSSVLSAGVLTKAGSDEQKKAWLPAIAGGDAILTPAWLEPDNGYGPFGVQLAARPDGEDLVLDGIKRHVHFASSADRLLVLARTGPRDTDVDVFLVDPKTAGIKLEQQMSLASDTQFKVTFDAVRVSQAERIGAAGSGWATWNEVMHDGIIMCAAQAIGGAERALEITVQYAKEREQFDRPIGSFQSLAHYMADGATLIDGGKTLVYQAAWARANGKPVNRLAPMAKMFACNTYRDVTAMCEQVHGGYGFTIDFDIQLYFRRAKQLQLSWWDTRYLEELTAAAVLDA
jgi:alkylation response protein AidB-like acyl-CoA dehydrogenase